MWLWHIGTLQRRYVHVMLETKTTDGKPSRHLAALEYQPEKKTLRLITLY